MKRTQVTELFADIKTSFVSFFSILMFVALGIGVFLGISWSGPALQNAADKMFREGQFHNFQIQYVYGLTDADLEELKNVEGVTQIEAERQSFQTLKQGDTKTTVKVQSFGQDINVPIVVEGELPSEPDEMALHTESAKSLGVGVGDTVTFEHDATADNTANLLSDDASVTDNAQPTNTSGMKYLTRDTFKVTAIVNSADYVAKSAETYGYSNAPSGAVDALAWVTSEAFDAAAFQNGYPIVNMKCESLDGLSTFSDEYKRASNEIENRITTLGQTLEPARFNDLHGRAEAKILDAEKQLAEGKQKIADGEKQLAEGRTELETKKAEADKKLADSYNELMNYESQRAAGEAKLAESRAEVEEGEAALATADAAKAEVSATADDAAAYQADQDRKLKNGEITQKEHDANLDAYGARVKTRLQPYAAMIGETAPDINHSNFGAAVAAARSLADNFENMTITYKGETMTVKQARAKLADARAQLNAGEAEYNQRVAQLNAGWAQYYAGQEERDRLVAEGEKKIADGEKEVADAKAKVAENEPKVTAARAQFDDMKEDKWAVLPRAHNAGAGEVSTFSSVTDNLSVSMATLFIVVGLLVTYFAVSRIVREQITQIGTKKALGFHRGEITRLFLLYSGIAVLAGAIIGTIVGFIVVEGIIGNALGDMFTFGAYPPYFDPGLFAIMTLLELALVLGATYLACRSILKEQAVSLLRGEKPPAGKARFYEKWAIWDRLPLLIQTIVNNCFNDKRRVLSTIVGVAGSTALIVTAITLNNDVLKSYDRHYADVYGFNTITYLDSSVDGAADNLEKALQGESATTTRVFMKRYLMEQPNGESTAVRIVVPDDESSFSQMYHVNPVSEGEFDLSAEGAWVSQAYGEHMGVKVGDSLTICTSDGEEHKVPVLGFYTFWLTYHEVVMNGDYYQKEFGSYSTNAILAQTGDKAATDVRQAISGIEGFDSFTDDATYQHRNFEMFSSVSSAVVAIYLALAALMAIVVLLNLNVMFINEKKRELIVLMINGFSVKDAKHYISYDSIVLTALGIIVGLILGCIMGSVTVAAIEPPTGVFVKSVDGWAVAIGIIGSALLSIIMSMIALRRIPKFSLTDINKL